MSSSLDVDPHQRDVEFLDKYAMDRWESVLQFLVQPGRGQTAISRDAMRTLLHAGLIERYLLSYRIIVTLFIYYIRKPISIWEYGYNQLQ